MFEKAKLSMHIGSSRRFARKIKHYVSDLKSYFSEFDDFDKDFKKAIESKNLDEVKKVFNSFLKECLHTEETIQEIKEGEFIIEHRLIQHLKEVEKELSDIKSSIGEKFQGELKTDYEELEKLFTSIISSLRKAKLSARDLKRDKERLRDKNILPNAMIFFILKIASRHEKQDTRIEKKAEKKVLDDLHELISIGKQDSNKITSSQVKKLAKDLKKFEKSIVEEFKEALKIEHQLVIISFRLEDINEEEVKILHGLIQTGFPKDYINEVDAKEREFLSELTKEQKEDYRYARTLLGESKALN